MTDAENATADPAREVPFDGREIGLPEVVPCPSCGARLIDVWPYYLFVVRTHVWRCRGCLASGYVRHGFAPERWPPGEALAERDSEGVVWPDQETARRIIVGKG